MIANVTEAAAFYARVAPIINSVSPFDIEAKRDYATSISYLSGTGWEGWNLDPSRNIYVQSQVNIPGSLVPINDPPKNTGGTGGTGGTPNNGGGSSNDNPFATPGGNIITGGTNNGGAAATSNSLLLIAGAVLLILFLE